MLETGTNRTHSTMQEQIRTRMQTKVEEVVSHVIGIIVESVNLVQSAGMSTSAVTVTKQATGFFTVASSRQTWRKTQKEALIRRLNPNTININTINVILILKFLILVEEEEQLLMFDEPNFEDIITPINVREFKKLLYALGYDKQKSDHLIEGFTHGFSLGYKGSYERKLESNNIPLKVGSPTVLWNKLMKKVKEHRVAGPFKKVPSQFYVQSPIGLVPKAGNSGKTRLIFHLLYDFGQTEEKCSINFHTPKEDCKVKYNDLDVAIRQGLNILKKTGASTLFYAKSDCSNAFRLVPLKLRDRFLLVMKAQHPKTKIWYYFMTSVFHLELASAV